MDHRTKRDLSRTLKAVRCRTEAVKTLRLLLREQPRRLSALFKNLKAEELILHGSGTETRVIVDRRDCILVWRVNKYPSEITNKIYNPFCLKGHIDIFER